MVKNKTSGFEGLAYILDCRHITTKTKLIDVHASRCKSIAIAEYNKK
jgi:hypothetical protein